MKVKFVEFKKCFCGLETDLICVSCDKWFCGFHKRVCVQCEQVVCEECYKEDLCCLVRPWGEKQERHMRDFYQNKLDGGLYSFDDNVKYGNEYRMGVVKRTIKCCVDNFDASSLVRCKPEFARDFFPSITKYVKTEEKRLKFVSFMEEVIRRNSSVFSYFFLNNDMRKDLLTVMDEAIRSNERMQKELIYYAMKSKDLFDSLKNRKLLDWNLVQNKYCSIEHINAMKWIEQNGVDVVNNEKHFKKYLKNSPAKIMEYLIVEKGMTFEYMAKNMWRVSFDILKMVFRLKGIEGIQKIDFAKFVFDFKTAKFLISIGYKFNEKETNCVWIYEMVCLKKIKYEDLNETQSKIFDIYVKTNDIKACKHLYPFMKEIRRKKIMTVILCIRKTRILQKEIIWNILDLAYSPINERGPL